MLCEYFSVSCFVLVQIWDKENLINSTNLSCQQRCEKIGHDVPSFTRVNQSDWGKIYSLCQKEYDSKITSKGLLGRDKVCAFPIKTKYSFVANQWSDNDSNEVMGYCNFHFISIHEHVFGLL